jgi:hypothetical protein
MRFLKYFKNTEIFACHKQQCRVDDFIFTLDMLLPAPDSKKHEEKQAPDSKKHEEKQAQLDTKSSSFSEEQYEVYML